MNFIRFAWSRMSVKTRISLIIIQKHTDISTLKLIWDIPIISHRRYRSKNQISELKKRNITMDPTYSELLTNGSKAIFEFIKRNEHEECFSNFQNFSFLQFLFPVLIAWPIFHLRSIISNLLNRFLPHWEHQNREKMVESVHQVIIYG